MNAHNMEAWTLTVFLTAIHPLTVNVPIVPPSCVVFPLFQFSVCLYQFSVCLWLRLWAGVCLTYTVLYIDTGGIWGDVLLSRRALLILGRGE